MQCMPYTCLRLSCRKRMFPRRILRRGFEGFKDSEVFRGLLTELHVLIDVHVASSVKISILEMSQSHSECCQTLACKYVHLLRLPTDLNHGRVSDQSVKFAYQFTWLPRHQRHLKQFEDAFCILFNNQNGNNNTHRPRGLPKNRIAHFLNELKQNT